MTNNWLFIIVVSGIVLLGIGLDFLSYKVRSDGRKPLIFTIQDLLKQVWGRIKESLPNQSRRNLSATENDNSQRTKEEAPTQSAVAEKQGTTLTISAPTPTDTSQQPEEAETNSDGQKMVHIQFTGFSADIPKGMTISFILNVTDEQGNTSVQKATLAQDMPSGSVSIRPMQENNVPTFISVARKEPASTALSKQTTWSERKSFLSNLPHQVLASIGQFSSAVHLAVAKRAKTWSLEPDKFDRLLLIASLAIYALVVSIGIDRFPIYFFTDEAIHMNLASDFIRDGFKNYFGEFLPTFFTTSGWVNGISVYVQVLPFILFGKSVLVTRLVSAFISLLGALSVGLLLKDVFKFRYYWAGTLLVLTTPAWFLHARTAFEYVEVGSFYAIFLYFYGRYRAGYLRSLYWAIIAGALAFYTHGLGQMLMSVTGLALFIVDFRYHIHPDRRKTVLGGLLLVTILLLPFARYYWAHPGEAAAQIKRRDSYWVDGNLTLLQKFGQFLGQYVYGLSPNYWYFPNKVDLTRHIMDGYGNGLWPTIPFVVIGLIQSIRNIRQPAYRMVLIALLACPFPASIVAIGMPRMLFMTIPLAILGMIGIATILGWAQKLEQRWEKWHLSSNLVAPILFTILAGLSVFMLWDALVNGPTWFTNYSLYGMQYGAKQVFQDVVRTGLEKDPDRRYIVSPSWANGTEQFTAFFIPKALQPRIRMGQPIDFIDTLKKDPADLYFIATSDEYDKLIKNPEFSDIKVEQMLPFPDGKPGFYVITLNVVKNIDQIISAEEAVERTPIEDTAILNGQKIRVIHSPLGSGSLQDVFDTNPDTAARVLRANPFTFALYMPTPISTKSANIQTGSLANFTITISLYAPDATDPITYSQTFKDLPPDPLVTMNFDKGPAQSSRIYIEIKDNTSGDSSQIHVRTIQFK